MVNTFFPYNFDNRRSIPYFKNQGCLNELDNVKAIKDSSCIWKLFTSTVDNMFVLLEFIERYSFFCKTFFSYIFYYSIRIQDLGYGNFQLSYIKVIASK